MKTKLTVITIDEHNHVILPDITYSQLKTLASEATKAIREWHELEAMRDVDWESAPAWAMFHVFNSEGYGYWYRILPVAMIEGWFILNKYNVPATGRLMSGYVINPDCNWKVSLVQRPSMEK